MTPVEATTICVASRPSNAAVCSAVARLSRSPRSPVHALAQPELQTSARILVPLASRCSSLTRIGAALISLVVITETAFCSSSKTISARSGLRFLIPAWTPASVTPGTAPMPPRSSTKRVGSGGFSGSDAGRENDSDNDRVIFKGGFLRIAVHEVEILQGLACRALAEVVERRQDANDAAAATDVKLGVVGPGDRDEAGCPIFGQDEDERARVVGRPVGRFDGALARLA